MGCGSGIIPTPLPEQFVELPTLEQYVDPPGPEQSSELPMLEQYVDPPGPEQSSELPMLEQYVEPPGPEQFVELPIFEQYVEPPDPEQFVELPIFEQYVVPAKALGATTNSVMTLMVVIGTNKLIIKRSELKNPATFLIPPVLMKIEKLDSPI